MSVIICPGIHSAELTDSFVQEIQISHNQDLPKNWLIFPTQQYPAYSAIHIYQWLKKSEPVLNNSSPMIFIAFSAGVVGAIGAAKAWQMQGGKIKAFIALDGWGVPLVANFPICRCSHDHFTHWSSAILGSGSESFYADPAVAHLDLWRSPKAGWGWRVISPGFRTRCSLAHYLQSLLT